MADSHKEQRIDELEEEVSQLRNTVQRMLPNRRAVIKGGAAAAATGMLGFSAGSASASGLDDGDTQWGSDSNRDDYVVDHIDSNSIDSASYSVGSSSALISVAATGQVQLSSGTAVVDTGLSTTDATFYLALGVDDPGADAKITGRLFWDDSAGTYKVEMVEDGTSVGNPYVNYDILRVR